MSEVSIEDAFKDEDVQVSFAAVDVLIGGDLTMIEDQISFPTFQTLQF